MPPKSADTIRQPALGSSDSRAHIIHLPGRRDTLTISEQALPPTPTDAERALILRICLRVTRDRDAAEDLAQETLLEAWRHWQKLREPDDPQARARWLSAIAANVCRRWGRRAGRDLAHTTRLTTLDEGAEPGDNMELRADEGDALDTELEHAERAQLLDRALG
ncbi:MAG TPA: sigma-70 family RNA polymerase sigma factor, partial [Ktedonobacterales bacterium]|nr:sigma-70 family RNA polymerase sigma factor [Ktedonobacterales bacterium]